MILEVAVCTVGRPSLAATLASLRRQARPPDRVIVVHQGDEELSADLIRGCEYLRLDSRGLSRARNVALKAFSGDWLLWCDDDEEVSADWVQQAEILSEAFPQAAFLGGPMLPPLRIDSGFHVDALFAVGETRIDVESYLTNPKGVDGLIVDCWGGNMAHRRDLIETVGEFDEHLGAGTAAYPFGEETDYHMRALTKGFTGLLSSRMTIYHTFGARPLSPDTAESKTRSSAAIIWKSRQDAEVISPQLAERLLPLSAKRALLSKLTAGVAFPDQAKMQSQFDQWFDELDSGYKLADGRLEAR